MNVRQHEEERQKREQFLKKENEALNRHKGELIEKVWALESKINRWASKQGELNVFLQQRSADGWGNNVIDVAMQHIQKLEHENKRLREALEFYADKKNHQIKWYDIPSTVGFDFGETARQALKGDNNDTT